MILSFTTSDEVDKVAEVANDVDTVTLYFTTSDEVDKADEVAVDDVGVLILFFLNIW